MPLASVLSRRARPRSANRCQCSESGGAISAKQLEMLSEERESGNNNNNDESSPNNNISCDHLSASQQMSSDEIRVDEKSSSESRSSSALSSSSCGLDELEAGASSARSTPLSSSSSGLEHSASPSPEPEQQQQQVAGGGRQLNAQPNVVPETGHVLRLVEAVRERFLASLERAPAAEQLYEEADLAAMRAELPELGELEQSLATRLVVRFLPPSLLLEQASCNQQQQRALDEAAAKLAELLAFRRRYQLATCRADQFCQELFQLHGLFPFGRDKQNLPVLYLRAQVHRRWSAKLDEQFRRYVAWQIDQLTRSQPGARVQKRIGAQAIEKEGSFGICFDCLNVSYSCVDMDFLRFLVRLLVNYYPTYCRYALCVDLPWLFRSVWKLVRSWLPEDAQNTVQLITSSQLSYFIDEQQIPLSIKTNSQKSAQQQQVSESRKHKLPPNYESIRKFDEFARELGLDSAEIKAFKSHLDKVLKDYRQLGAI